MTTTLRLVAGVLGRVPGVVLRDEPAARMADETGPGVRRFELPLRCEPDRPELLHEMPRRVRRRGPVTRRGDDGCFVVGTRDEVEQVRWCRPAGRGLLRHLGDDDEGGMRLEFLSSWTLSCPEAHAADEGDRDEPGLPVDREEGVRVRLRMPPPGGPPRGVVVHLRGLGGHDVEDATVEPLRRRGRAIVEIVYPLVNWRRVVADVDDPASIDAAGAALADILDHRFSEIALAAEAALAPWPGTPIPREAAEDAIVLAWSAGGNAAAAVAAHLGRACTGLGVVAAGADLMHISVRCGLPDTGFDVVRSGTPTDRTRLDEGCVDELSAAYRRHARMDGLVAGPHVRAPRRLVIEGRGEAVIPAPAGDRLHEALGRPARWRCLGGHRGAYALVAGRAEAFATVLDRG